MNDNTAQNPERPPQPQTGDKPRKQKVQGKALQVNENSVETRNPPLHGETDRTIRTKKPGRTGLLL
ncbi:hypothetical protein LJR234_001140 [Mesorhizobium amorphae]|uniref:hypothetical protein n=1 Tax=Mesorhizobium amorphae TaxID=71433 RepID=UPI003ECF4D48